MNNELLTAGNLYGSLINDIGNILVEARGKICREINSVMVDAYWNIGKYIVEYEQKGEERAEYGSNLLNRLSKDLTRLYGKGFGKSSFWPGTRKKLIRGMRQWRSYLRFRRTGPDGSARSALSGIICSIAISAAVQKLATAATVTARFRFGSRSTMRLPDAPDAENRCSSNPLARWAGCVQGEISCI